MKSRLTILFMCLLFVTLAPIMGAPVVAAEGTTIIVTSIADSGPGTLRQALLDAQSGDTITFDPAVFSPSTPATIYLTDGLPVINQGNLKIDASNAGVILDGSNIGEGFIPCLDIISDGNVVHGLQFANFAPGAGVRLSNGAQHNLVGGDRLVGSGPLGQGNLMSSGDVGICLGGDGTSFNIITGNLIGTDASGTYDRGNSSSGVGIEDGATHNIIGPNNIIAYNVNGIEIWDSNSIGNTITQNSIHDNVYEGIPLLNGGNTELPTPVIIEFDLAAGTVTGIADAGCTIEVFSDSSDEGEIYEGQTTADGSGFFAFSKGTSLTGPCLTATATDADGNTSGFSVATTGASYTVTAVTDRTVTGDEVWQDETITLDGKVIVESGASLTMRNVNLTFDNPTDEGCGIIAEPGSSLAIYNSTLSRPQYSELGGFYIYVENASFVLKDSVLDGASHFGIQIHKEWVCEERTAALTLDHIQGAVIEGNVIKNIPFSVMALFNVSDSIITNNTITPLAKVQGQYPSFLTMWESRNNTITDNYVTGVSGAISMQNHSTGNYVAGNKITTRNAGRLNYGVWLNEDSNNNILANNEILDSPGGGNAIMIYTRNNVIKNNTIRDFKWGIIIAAGADGNIVANNNISKIYHEDAIIVYRSNGNYIINNDISSSIRGISISRYSQNNIVQANIISNSRQGILVDLSSDNNLIVNNEVSENDVGIMVYQSAGNKIYDNNFIDNDQQGYDEGSNIWSVDNRGNYWSDYRGEGNTDYEISPGGIDEYPLNESVLIVPAQVPEPVLATFREIFIPPVQVINGEVKYENTEILMENSYRIPEGGTLILENVTLRSYKEAAAIYKIEVEGGTLIISNSIIIAPETGIAPITIHARGDSTLVIQDSEFYHIDSGMHDPGPSGGGIVIDCEGAIVEGNYIADSRVSVRLGSRSRSAHVVNNIFEGCMMPTWSSTLGGDHLIEGNTVRDLIPAEKLDSELELVAIQFYHMFLYWLRDLRVIAGSCVIGIGVIALVWFLIRRRRRKKAIAAGSG